MFTINNFTVIIILLSSSSFHFRQLVASLSSSSVDDEAIVTNDEAELLQRLRQRYYGYGLARPVAQVNKTMEVALLFVINEFLGIDELTGTIKVTAVITATWQDDMLRWNPAKYHNLTAVPMQTKDIFLPTIVKDGNGGTQSSIFMTGNGQNDRDINAMVWVRHTGQVEAIVNGNYASNCKLNLADFPFDTHHCNFVFKVWRYDDKRIRLTLDDEQKANELTTKTTMTNLNANANWLMASLTSRSVTIADRENGANFSAITYSIECHRRTDFYAWNVIAPTFAMIVLLLATFFMPFGSSRCIFTITLVLTLNIFQQALSAKLPITAEVIPYVRQLTVQVLLGIFVTLESCLVYWIANKQNRSAVPIFLRILVPKLREARKVEEQLLASSALSENGVDDGAIVAINKSMTNMAFDEVATRMRMMIKEQSPSSSSWNKLSDWQEVAQFIDWIAFTIVNACIFVLPIFFYRHRF